MTERIDHSNYEAWLLDRLEGNLTPEQEALLDAFLAAYPELDSILTELPTLHELDARLTRTDKDALKRSLPPTGIPSEPIDDFLIARLEGDLDTHQEEALRAYLLEHPQHQRAKRLYALTKLVPEAMAYRDKQALARQLPPRGVPTRYSLNDFLVARLEGDLTTEQQRSLDLYLVHDADARREWALMQHARISPIDIVFAGKDDLKKGGKVIAIGAGSFGWKAALRVAAVVVVLLGAGIWVLTHRSATGPRFATVQPVDDTSTPADKAEERTPSKELDSTSGPPQAEAPTPAPLIASPTTGQGSKPGVTKHRTDPAPEPVAVPAEVRPEETLLALEPLLPNTNGQKEEERQPIHRVDPIANEPASIVLTAAAPSDAQPKGIPLGDFLAGKLRKQLFDKEGSRPLDSDDALAAVDKGLRTVVGSHAGLELERTASGRVSSFELRLGRNLAVSANR